MASITSSIAADEGSDSLPTFETLVSYLLAAKRSLGCVEHVSRANSLVTSTRQVLEQHTIQNARAEFLHAGSIAQTQVLQQIQQHTQGVFHESVAEYAEMIRNFEQAEARLNGTLEQLRATMVERALRPAAEEAKSLADFIDETGAEQLKDAVHASVAAFGEARQEYVRNTADFDAEVAAARELLASHSVEKGSAVTTTTTGSLQEVARGSPLPSILQRMEEHAQEMASNLESLVKHFDLCITALKHTDRGDGAFWSELGDDELPAALRAQLEEQSKSTGESLETLPAAERREMLEVVQKDAGEVDDVVEEIRAGLAEMEADADAVERHSVTLSAQEARTGRALALLDALGAKLPAHVTHAQLFTLRFDDERAAIAARTREASELRAFYVSFLGGYDRLLIEIGRRQDTRRRIHQIAADALQRIEALRADEESERMAFRRQQGDFLPVDLWPGLLATPARWTFAQEGDGDKDHEADSVPDVSASTINRAIRGVERAQRGSIGGASGSTAAATASMAGAAAGSGPGASGVK